MNLIGNLVGGNGPLNGLLPGLLTGSRQRRNAVSQRNQQPTDLPKNRVQTPLPTNDNTAMVVKPTTTPKLIPAEKPLKTTVTNNIDTGIQTPKVSSLLPSNSPRPMPTPVKESP